MMMKPEKEKKKKVEIRGDERIGNSREAEKRKRKEKYLPKLEKIEKMKKSGKSEKEKRELTKA